MKINPVAIQTYQQISKQEQRQPLPQKDTEPLPKKNSLRTDESVTISPGDQPAGSRLAVKAPSSSYADLLTTSEKQALDLLFSRFRDSERFGPGYRQETAEESVPSRLGQIIDIKV